MNKLKIGIPVALILILFAVGVFTPLGTIFKYKYAPNLPQYSSHKISIKNLKDEVSVYFDQMGVPHIEAQNIADLVRVTGYIQARERGWQLEVLRHFASGRLSELLGEQPVLSSTTVEFDLAMRAWNFEQKVQVDLDSVPELDKEILLAFSDGINQGFNDHPTVEHKILGLKSRPWKVSDSLLVSILQAWSITHNWEQEAVRYNIALNLGVDIANEIYPNDPVTGLATIRSAQFDKQKLPPYFTQAIASYFPKGPKPITQTSENQVSSVIGDLAQIRPSASNAWAVGASRSQTGMPIVSNDMHLTHSLPSLLFIQHIKAPGVDAIGATMPGLPFIVGGHNGKVAWGSTSAVADVVDLIIEKIDPQNSNRVLNENKICELTQQNVEIKIRDEKSKTFKLRKTCNGFALNDAYPKFLPKSAPLTVVRWQTPKVQESLGHLLRANKSSSAEELRANMMKIPSPIQNITAADIQGNLAFFSTGAVPIRKEHRGTFPVPGWKREYEWSGSAKIEEMPYILNPESNYLINTNNLARDPHHSPILFQIDSAPDYRYTQAEQRILAIESHTQDTIEAIQSDTKMKRGEKILSNVLNDFSQMNGLTSLEQSAVDVLKNWNFDSATNSIGTSIFMGIYREAIIESMKEKITSRALHLFLKQRYSTNVVDTWFFKSDHVVWDNLTTPEVKETRLDVLKTALKKTVSRYRKKFGDNLKQWEWGKLHTFHARHMFGKKSILSFLNLPKIPLGGSLDSVWKAHFNLSNDSDPFKTVAGPVFRSSMDLSDLNQARFSIDTGQSGWAGSKHYDDFFQLWRKGKLANLKYNWKEIKEKFANRLMTVTPL